MFITPGYAQEAAPQLDATQAETSVAPEGEARVFPPFDSTFYPSQILWLVVTFGLFYLFISRVIMPRLGGIIEEREKRIASDLEAANRMRAESDAAVAAYERELAEARAKANAIGQEARDAAKADADAERKRVEAGLDARLSDAQSRIDQLKASAMGEVGTIATETADAILRRLSGRDIDRTAVEAAVATSRG
ncbi:MAG: F0F1 ATP synthase subunit B [Methylobacterium mesophilicum]|nr:F0F1 ATP synthase subunit B [Methylobacterium mesophilicum]